MTIHRCIRCNNIRYGGTWCPACHLIEKTRMHENCDAPGTATDDGTDIMHAMFSTTTHHNIPPMARRTDAMVLRQRIRRGG